MNYKLLAIVLFVAMMSCGCGSSLTAPTAAPATLVSLSISGSSVQKVRLGQTLQLHAFGHYSDGSDREITAEVSWSASLPGVLLVTNGQVFARAIGSSRIFITITMPDLSDSIMIEVIPAGSGLIFQTFSFLLYCHYMEVNGKQINQGEVCELCKKHDVATQNYAEDFELQTALRDYIEKTTGEKVNVSDIAHLCDSCYNLVNDTREEVEE